MSTLLDRLVDDAAIFPPGNAPLDVAVREHAGHRSSAYAAMVGPLLVRDVDVAHVPGLAHEALEIGVVATTGPRGLEQSAATLHDFPHVHLVAYEIALGDLSARDLVSALRGSNGVTVSVELPRPGAYVSDDWLAVADEVAAAGFQVKFRTGGVEASAYPDEKELAMVLAALVPRRFKLTAGLHRAVRNTQAGTGFEQHGFLNVMVAVHRLLAGSTADEAAAVLASRDGGVLAAEVASWRDDDRVAVRRTFRGFGCCGVTEPYEDLVGLGLA
ncbi:hypothetical protein ASE12_16110 [Aeromicrobium sp. Root236]|uniref:hypothetical protein n=1 Tax=Aeromicrobium sp. Root236 TaxID=1736498 RepID=UPI0006F86E69|nr:hypothetical protein [Aeromicrobium sp. Root236]KRC66144.1 hypothetical protein ASE12_16110 [Aeromicrobium sp. Root236]